MPRGQAKHDSPIAPFQQETPGRDTAILKLGPFKFQSHGFSICSAVSFVSCYAMLCYAMLCYAMLYYAPASLLAGIDTVHMQRLHDDCG